ncbi:head-tail connector protein [Endozoicomonas gorgoniicola]|uniref:Head-tail connector protein n=1 Tax=Endozoicomonas gorgoniicola TaxID=1234144 RepID=A0ABT3MRY4_9GAMM|nr:head-tail connector protein [Endozoicomonas gorgoniicola]MCW7552139.1 head-tail connector protein [Endozoicomonas gorgoniicola]
MDKLLPLVKKHIRSERDDEDDYLKYLVEAAVSRFNTFTGRTLRLTGTDPDTLEFDDIPLRMDICHGLLLLVGQWYEYRENAVERALSEMPEATKRLWEPYVIYHLGDT